MVEAKKRILVIDDEQDVVTYLQTWLTDEGYEVETARDGIEGLEKFTTFHPDLVTLDIVMPQKTGIMFYSEIKENKRSSQVPVIILTGLQQEFRDSASGRSLKPAPDAYVAKPFSREELLETIRSLLSRNVAHG
jgi:DNA-binding response OmpR family regulator